MANTFEPIKINISVEGTNQAVNDIALITTQLEKLQSVSKSLTNVMKTTFDFSTKNITKNSQKNVLNTGTVNNIKNYNRSINKTNDSIKKASSSTSIFNKDTLKLGISLFTMKKAINYLSDAMDESASWVENLNVMEVAFGKLSSNAYQFTKTLSEGFGLDANEILKYVSLFQQMASAMGQTTETAYMMSTALTSLGVDVASLYNKDIGVTMEALRSAIAGQVKPVRQFGFDITAYSIDSLLEQIEGFEDITSRALSQSQKQLARTILLLQQSKNAWGDLGKTLNTYSNQQKILSAQFTNLKRALGDLFVGTGERVGIATKALYVINGVLMSIVSIIRTFIPEASSSGFNDMQNDVDDTTESIEELESATKGALTSFDKFNTLSSGSGDGDIGITSALQLKLAEEYDKYLEQWNKRMETVTSKAHEIRDTIMQWLGFIKQVNEETGQITWLEKDSSVMKTLKSIVGIFKEYYTLYSPMIKNLANNIIPKILGLVKQILPYIQRQLAAIMPVLLRINEVLIPLIEKILNIFSPIIIKRIEIFTKAIEFLSDLLFGIVDVLGDILNFIYKIGNSNIVKAFGKGLLSDLKGFVNMIKSFLSPLFKLFDLLGNIGYKYTPATSITGAYAKGGIPDEGQLFIANEAGAELVGNIGGRTAVANNDMIVSAIEMASFRGVSRAMSTSGTNNTINFSFNGVNSSELARAIAQPMASELKRQGYKISKI